MSRKILIDRDFNSCRRDKVPEARFALAKNGHRNNAYPLLALSGHAGDCEHCWLSG